MEKLRALMQAQPEPPAVSFGDPGDPIEYLKALSGDAEGREILAILLEVLESGFVACRRGDGGGALCLAVFRRSIRSRR